MNQSKLEANTCSRHKARENVREQVAISLGFTSDWLRKWRESFKPITECSNAKPKQTRITFDTQVKTALSSSLHQIGDKSKHKHQNTGESNCDACSTCEKVKKMLLSLSFTRNEEFKILYPLPWFQRLSLVFLNQVFPRSGYKTRSPRRLIRVSRRKENENLCDQGILASFCNFPFIIKFCCRSHAIKYGLC